jgi:hypothetical protein
MEMSPMECIDNILMRVGESDHFFYFEDCTKKNIECVFLVVECMSVCSFVVF